MINFILVSRDKKVKLLTLFFLNHFFPYYTIQCSNLTIKKCNINISFTKFNDLVKEFLAFTNHYQCKLIRVYYKCDYSVTKPIYLQLSIQYNHTQSAQSWKR